MQELCNKRPNDGVLVLHSTELTTDKYNALGTEYSSIKSALTAFNRLEADFIVFYRDLGAVSVEVKRSDDPAPVKKGEQQCDSVVRLINTIAQAVNPTCTVPCVKVSQNILNLNTSNYRKVN